MRKWFRSNNWNNPFMHPIFLFRFFWSSVIEDIILADIFIAFSKPKIARNHMVLSTSYEQEAEIFKTCLIQHINRNY